MVKYYFNGSVACFTPVRAAPCKLFFKCQHFNYLSNLSDKFGLRGLLQLLQVMVSFSQMYQNDHSTTVHISVRQGSSQPRLD